MFDVNERQLIVHFAGEGSGVAEMSWGQLEIWGAMQRQRTWMPLPAVVPLPPGVTVDDVADWARYVMSRHQTMRTRLRFRPDGPPQQVLYGSGDLAMDVVESGRQDPAQAAQMMVDRYVEHDFDFARDWPIFVAVILANGTPVYRVVTICHFAIDMFGARVLREDLDRRDDASGTPPPVTATDPVEQARWQRSPAGQRHNAAVLRHWAELLRAMPARRFPAPADRGEPRYRQLSLDSPATHLAIQIIRHRTRATSAQVILTMFLVALARSTGINPSMTRVAVNNRFRRTLTSSVSVVTQYGLCIVDVAGITFDEAVTRLKRRIVATFKHAYYDPIQVAELVDQVGRERGEEIDVHCYYNDRRQGEDSLLADSPPTPAAVVAALPDTSIVDQPLPRAGGSERLFAAVEESADSFRLMLDADTHYVSRETMVACARAVEDIAVEAARDAAAPTGVPVRTPSRDLGVQVEHQVGEQVP